MSAELNNPFVPSIPEIGHRDYIGDHIKELCLQEIEKDPNLVVRTSSDYTGTLEVRYTDKSKYGQENLAFLAISKIPHDTENNILLTQTVEENKKNRILNIVIPLDSISEAVYYTSEFRSVIDSKIPVQDITKRARGGIDRVESVLETAENFISIYLLYQDFLMRNKKNIPQTISEHFHIEEFNLYDNENNHILVNYQRRALELIRRINEGRLGIKPNSSTENPTEWIISSYHCHDFLDLKHFLEYRK